MLLVLITVDVVVDAVVVVVVVVVIAVAVAVVVVVVVVVDLPVYCLFIAHLVMKRREEFTERCIGKQTQTSVGVLSVLIQYWRVQKRTT